MRDKPFIDDLVDKIHRHAAEHPQLTVVLPSQRVVRTLSVKLAQARAGEVFWLPRFRTMDEFVYEVSGLRPADPLWLSLRLYAHYERRMREVGETPRAYADFMEWGALLLSDFHQLDAQLAPVAEVLNYVAEEKRIAGLDFSLNEQSELQAAYLRFFTQLYPIYERFTAELLAEGVAYQGLAERRVVEMLKTRAETTASEVASGAMYGGEAGGGFLLFAGFNAITEAEAEIMRQSVKAGQAEVYWDADRYYVDDPLQEAGLFLRRYAADPYIGRHIRIEEMTDGIKGGKIIAQGVPQWTGQAEMAADYIARWYLQEGFTGRTAVVLNEEALLQPLLNALPEAPGLSYNLSVGVPLHGTRTHGWVEILCNGREEAERARETGEAKISVETLTALWRSDCFTAALKMKRTGDARPAVEKVLKNLFDANKGYFTQADWPELGRRFGCADTDLWRQIGDFWFDTDTDARAYGRALLSLLRTVAGGEAAAPDLSPYEREYGHLAIDCLMREEAVRATCEAVRMPFYVWKRQTLSALSGLCLHYKGNPEARVQISGMLETRMLDFDRVIILSMNEGVLPSGQYEASFLLDALKRHCHIPTLKERNAMQAYYFYRLLAFPSRVVCLYQQTEKQEKSRFLWQLAYEQPQMAVEPAAYPFPMARDHGVGGIEIPKSGAALERIGELFAYGLSPSAMQTYLSCGLKFYFNYVLRLSDRDEFNDTLDAARKGTVVHKVLEDFFNTRMNRPLTPADAAEFAKTYPCRLDGAIESLYADLPYKTGKNGLERKKMERWLHYFAKDFARETGRKDSPWRGVAACETKLRVPFRPSGGPAVGLMKGCPENEVLLSGFADRVDLWKDGERIVDYKTAAVDSKELNLKTIEDLDKPEHGKALQLLLYAYMYWVSKGRRAGTFPEACIYAMAKLQAGYIALGGDWMEETDEAGKVAALEAWLSHVVNDMADPTQPFTQNLAACRHCAYADLCGL